MPPRTTRKSYRPRVSDRTMVGIYNRSACCARKIDACRSDITMNLQKSENRSVPSQCGLDHKSSSSHRRSIFLDIPFHRTRLPKTWSTSPPFDSWIRVLVYKFANVAPDFIAHLKKR